MTDQEFHQLIEDSCKEDRDRMHDRVLANVQQVVEEQRRKRTKRIRFVRRYVPLIAVALVIVCLSVVLPLTLQLSPEETSIRYLTDQLINGELGLSVKEYAQQSKLPLLYLDWYDNADFIESKKFTPQNDKKTIVYISETIVNEDGYRVTYSIMERKFDTDAFQAYTEPNQNLSLSNGIKVKYLISLSQIRATFEYKGYKYYINFTNNADETFMRETIESMFNQN